MNKPNNVNVNGSWYKKAQFRGYTLIETIAMQKEYGLSLNTMSFFELQEAEKYEKAGRIKKVKKRDDKTNEVYDAYVIVEK